MGGRSNSYGHATAALCGSCPGDITLRRFVDLWRDVDREPEMLLENAVLTAFLQTIECQTGKRESLDPELVAVLDALDWRADNRGDPGVAEALEVWYEKRVKDVPQLTVEEEGRRALVKILCNALPGPLAAPPRPVA